MMRWKRDEPNMSDSSMLVKVEDLIYMAIRTDNLNVVNFNVIQMVLHILARQLRMLEQQVEIRTDASLSKRKKVGKRGHAPADIHSDFSDSPTISITDEVEHPPTKRSPERDKSRKEKRGKMKSKGRESNVEDVDHHGRKEKKTSKGSARKYDGKTGKDRVTSHNDSKDLSDEDFTDNDDGLEEPGRQKNEEKMSKQDQNTGKIYGGDEEIDGKGKKHDKKHAVDAGAASETSFKIEGPRPRVGSVEVVTQSQFELLEDMVKQLIQTAAPLAPLILPDDEQFRSDLLKGNVTLTEAMQAMQVNARVQAAEKAISRMTGLLTQLAAAGAMPEDLAQKLNDVKLELAAGSVGGSDKGGFAICETMQSLKADMMHTIQQITSKASAAAESAAKTSRIVLEKLEVALQVDDRMNNMRALVADYEAQLDGLDAGFNTQMQGFQEQMGQIRIELKEGLEQLAGANDNTEATAIKELSERYESLVLELEKATDTNQALVAFQLKLRDELRALVESVEMMRDQKVDRDEILDALRDKADMSRLTGLLSEQEFATARSELESYLELCNEKFKKQDQAWMSAVEDIMMTVETKASQVQISTMREDLGTRLQELHQLLQKLEEQLGEPKAALLQRQLSRDAACGACGVAALAELGPPPAPPALPALHSPTKRAPPEPPALPVQSVHQPCITTLPRADLDDGTHLCRRWCGGSHTLLAAGRQHARAEISPRPCRHYEGLGTDGKLYLMEEELQPCEECNVPVLKPVALGLENPEVHIAGGAGDAAQEQG
ncbi:unnamed protein product [Parnassius apollo]|uniref:(apollo) hypothetical protein n=1 Tax=Parnassius apollo TaxID=110799 RepID=A0A8S3XJC1_PARAO|nr:unnamed protein product [Parnassius apollo]